MMNNLVVFFVSVSKTETKVFVVKPNWTKTVVLCYLCYTLWSKTGCRIYSHNNFTG